MDGIYSRRKNRFSSYAMAFRGKNLSAWESILTALTGWLSIWLETAQYKQKEAELMSLAMTIEQHKALHEEISVHAKIRDEQKLSKSSHTSTTHNGLYYKTAMHNDRDAVFSVEDKETLCEGVYFVHLPL
jgi:hypothetical protein